MASSTRQGWTLVELLAVCAVMALLASLLLPSLSQAREEARRSGCLSRLRQLSHAHQLYITDFDETLPAWQMAGSHGPVLWTTMLAPYIRDRRLLDDGFGKPRTPVGAEWLADYALCTWGPGGNGTLEEPYWRWPGAGSDGLPGSRPMALSEVRRPAGVLQIADGITSQRPRGLGFAWIWPRHAGEIIQGAYLDGHVRSIPESEWSRVERDSQGYFIPIASADR